METSEHELQLGSAGSTSRSNAPAAPPVRPKMPILGVIVGLTAVVGLAGWTATRVQAAQSSQQAVEVKRAADAKRTATQLSSPQPVRTVQGKAQTWQPMVEFEGSLAAAQTADLGFKAPGRIGLVRAKLGDVVKAGAVLATLDSNEAGAQLRAAQAQVRAAQAQLELSSDSERRTQQMVASGSLPEAQGVQSVQQKALALAQLDAARAQVGLVQVSLGNHALTAPFAGTVTRAPDAIGAVVAPGTVLFSLADLRTLKLKGTISEQDANLLSVGSPVEVSSDHGSVKGKVTALIGVVDAATRRVPVEAALENGGQLRAGSFVRARGLGGQAIPVLRLPHEVLRHGSQDEIFVARDGVLDGRRIVFSIDKDGGLLVRSGISATDQVVVSPKAEAQPGEKITVEAGSAP